MMGEELENQQRLQTESGELLPELQLLFTLKPGMDRRRYNAQRTNEVAAVFCTTADGEIPEAYVTIRNRNNKTLQNVSIMDPNVEPWIYPLFYPYGTQGWHRYLTKINSDRRITRGQYIKYRMAIRDEFNVFLLGRRLFQQWLVDSYVKMEKDRIDYCKNHQKELRSETYQGLRDYLQTTANNLNGRIGKMVILPSTFTGSPRNMLQHYQDAMAIVSKFGKPDLFITMTCNPKWREIEENLLSGQQASDRPDICARVFNIKKDYLIDLIVKQKFFGEVAAFVYVIEFQKRGLPHIHLLITLKYNFKITTSQIVDKYISAEIPDPDENRILHDIVMKHMIHGPCGDWCLVDGRCSKHFPKPYLEETRMDENAYPYYRRRDNGRNFERPGGYVVDNRYVVPYCPTLSIIFNSHINVEVVSSIKSVKYLYKYIYKGHDVAAITIEPITESVVIDHDEIHNYIEARYVGPVEASWRILAACLALGLIEDDDEWKRAMNEAVAWMMPRQLRRLFVRILLHCQPLHPEELWENFKEAMSEDYVRHFGMLQGQNKAYMQINSMLRAEGKSIADFPQMEQLIENSREEDYMTLDEDMEIGTKQYKQLNEKQKEIVDLLLNKLDNKNNNHNNCFYIDGPGGSATLLPFGKTVHKIFGLPVPLFADSSSTIKIQSKEAQYLKEIDIFIWDEAPMAPRYALEIMDRTLRDIMNNNISFGGKIVLLGGDFRQLLPIKVHAIRSEIKKLNL
ncbi:hypothetical protein RF55_10925 [Lasius niger]|uniref:ATP-dependent DNA helicase n=1 Tax=Lasius niger TaxID=67767 RepID=A0A0J7KGN8_LASNI|nr:hypothetical protein RF55_10925 [Lasius niger]